MLINAATRQQLTSPPAVGRLRSGVGPSRARRALDIAVSLGALLLLSPVLVAVAAAIRCTSPGSILFRQIRIGQGRRPFVIYKFRTMRTGASGPEVTAADDLRVTRIGKYLRSGLDELPQLLNILRGDMTLVGPRPETPALAARYPRACAVVFEYRPGLTGPSQIRLRDKDVLPSRTLATFDFEEHYLSEFVPMRTALDFDYLAHPSLRRTIRFLLETAVYLVGPLRRRIRRTLRRLQSSWSSWSSARDRGVEPTFSETFSETFAEPVVVEVRDQRVNRNRNW